MTSTRLTRRALAAGLSLLLATVASAAGKPDFSGFWKLNKEKSDYGQMPVPDNYAMVIDHKDPALNLVITLTNPMGDQKTESKLKTDGSQNVQTGGRITLTSTITWDGAVMVVKTLRSMSIGNGPDGSPQKMDVPGEERWQLSPDGKTLTIDIKMTGPQGELTVKRVLEKSAAAGK